MRKNKQKMTKKPKMTDRHVKEDTVIARNYITKKHTVNKSKGTNVAWNEYLLSAVKDK